MTHGSLFSGIGGFDLAARWMGWTNVFQVEKDSYCQKVLKKNFPNVDLYGDIKEFDGAKYKGAIDVISGGFPCQKYSVAGKRKGNEELAEEMLRVVGNIMPRCVVAENVYGFYNIDRGESLITFCASLESLGYQRPTILDATSDFTGVQTMERHLWIISKATGKRLKRSEKIKNQDKRDKGKFPRTDKGILFGRDISKTRFCRVDQRVSRKLDTNQRNRIKALGNAIVPQVAYEIFKAINEVTL